MATNARLKERALRFWLSMVSQPVTLHMYEKCVPHPPTTCLCSCSELTIDHLVPRNATQLKCSTTVEGTLCAVDAGQEHVQMSGLATPMYRYPEALVRTSDIRCLVAAPAAIATSTTTDPSTTLS
jgi:hypothetical protein